jgi:hypothetical protein
VSFTFVFTRNLMINKKINRAWSVLLLASISVVVTAQEPQELLGLPYNSPGVTALIESYNSPMQEEFLPLVKIYRQDYFDAGVSLDYNSDIALYRIAMFDSGFRYKAYAKTLPKGVAWGMDADQVQRKTGLLDFEATNPMKGTLAAEEYLIDFYFQDGKLYHVSCMATITCLENKWNDLLAGTGLRLLPNGTPTEGNVTDGTGTMRWGQGAAVYQGEWSYGLPHGTGQYLDSFGNKYEGEFKLGFFWGKGVYISKNAGFSYKGNLVMGKRHFKGEIVYNNTNAYEGDWVQDAMSGQGKYYLGTDYMYEGSMRNNAFNGKGVLTTPDGVVTGSFKDGKPHGVCTQKTPDGNQWAKGTFINGKKEGKFVVSIDGMQTNINYKNNMEVRDGNGPN